MKATIPGFVWVILFYGCNNSGSPKEADDSLQYYPSTPAALNKQEFRQYYRRLNELFDTTLLHGGFNGGILIARNGAIIYEKYTGLVDLRKKGPLTENTSLHIASTTKTFTAIAVLRMIQESKLTLTDSVNKFFPGFPYPGITVKMLLNHRSGLPNYLYFMSKEKWQKLSKERGSKQYVTNKDVLKFLVDEKPDKSYSVNKRFNYCNTNYVLLALIVEKISGKPFPEYMQEKFFQPLQMQHTFVFTLKDTATAAPSFTNNGIYWEYDFLDATYGDKNIYSTPRDLLKWDQALYTEQIINAAFLDSAFTAYSFEKPGVHNYGLGWRLQLMPNGKKIVYHFGKWHGFNAAFTRLTDEKATIIILGSRFTRRIYGAAHLCYDIFGDYQQRPTDDDEDSDSISANKKPTTSPERVTKVKR
ncbi:MAG: beta-lactamase family protein [Chitinophagaceae bacterium]|nr:beta-lactamase family protein [Chitinophagaceae bacterium]